MTATAVAYSRVLLKLSGEALAGDKAMVFDFERINRFADEIKGIADMGVSVGLVIGGGNIVRGSQLSKNGMDRVTADYMGMLGTVINALALQDVLERKGLDTRVMTAIRMEELAEPYIRRRALRHLEVGRTVIFAAGTGNPYFSTDTAAALRAIQIKADVIIKATSVDGVYSADPKKDPSATRFVNLTFDAWLFHPQLGELTDLARTFPETTIVLDHVGGVLGIGAYADKRDEVFAHWSSSIRTLASCRTYL